MLTSVGAMAKKAIAPCTFTLRWWPTFVGSADIHGGLAMSNDCQVQRAESAECEVNALRAEEQRLGEYIAQLEARVQELEAEHNSSRIHRGEDAEYWGRMYACENSRAERALAAFHRAETRAKAAGAYAAKCVKILRQMAGKISRLEADNYSKGKRLKGESPASSTWTHATVDSVLDRFGFSDSEGE